MIQEACQRQKARTAKFLQSGIREEFGSEEPARHWETEWPTIVHKVSVNPLVLLGGFTPLLSHATLTRDGRAIHVHLAATHDETQRLLALALHMLGG